MTQGLVVTVSVQWRELFDTSALGYTGIGRARWFKIFVERAEANDMRSRRQKKVVRSASAR
jgi:hypothetical protein